MLLLAYRTPTLSTNACASLRMSLQLAKLSRGGGESQEFRSKDPYDSLHYRNPNDLRARCYFTPQASHAATARRRHKRAHTAPRTKEFTKNKPPTKISRRQFSRGSCAASISEIFRGAQYASRAEFADCGIRNWFLFFEIVSECECKLRVASEHHTRVHHLYMSLCSAHSDFGNEMTFNLPYLCSV